MRKVGILTRKEYLNNKERLYIPYNVFKKLNNKVLVLLIPYDDNTSFKSVLQLIKLCDGIIIPGGDKESKLELKIVKYLYENNIPCLGICLGMQEMSLAINGKLKTINNHENKEHKIILDSNSKLYSILKKKILIVNSRHHDCVIKTDLTIVAKALDNTIEAVEDAHKKFFIGVQFHPEDMANNVYCKIINAFIDSLML